MRKDSKKRTNPKLPIAATGRINPTSPPQDELICFNFSYLVCSHNIFRYNNCEAQYFCKLLERLKNISAITCSRLLSDRRLKELFKFHPIDFTDKRIHVKVKGKGFGLANSGLSEDANDCAYQFSISKGLGRIHGYFVENIFYIVWLDPKHELYPKPRT